MTRRVLVAFDDSLQARAAFEYAVEAFDDAELVLLTVIDPGDAVVGPGDALPGSSEEWYENAKAEATDLLADAKEEAEDRGVAATVHTEVGSPASVVVEWASEADVDHVVMGSHGRTGVSRVLLGSVAESVVRRSPVPVTVVR